jgi:ADP-ribosylglycohydrolase
MLIGLGARRTGVRSAGCGAAMRSPVVGAVFAEDFAARRTTAQALAEVTHTDARAVAGAVFAADVAAACVRSPEGAMPDLVAEIAAADSAPFREALLRAAGLARGRASAEAAAREIGTSGFVLHAVPFAVFCFLRHAQDPIAAISAAVAAGGDTDTIAAITGAWTGSLHGAGRLPAGLLERLHDGPFGPTHLRGLARAIAAGTPPPRWSVAAATARNALLSPVILAHGLRRLLPPW